MDDQGLLKHYDKIKRIAKEEKSVLIDSFFLFDYFKDKTIKLAERSRNDHVFVIDYSDERPCQPMIESYGEEKLVDSLKADPVFFTRMDYSGESIEQIFRATSLVDHLDVISADLEGDIFLFFRNSQEMSKEQCKAMVNLSIRVVNTAQIDNLHLIFHGGDWWTDRDYRDIEFNAIDYVRKERAPKVDYESQSMIEAELSDYFDLLKSRRDKEDKTPFSTNIYGSNLSGKSYILDMSNKILFGLYIFYFSAYPNFTAEKSSAFLSQIPDRFITPEEVLLVDDAHRLDEKTLSIIQEKYPKRVLTSLEKMPGFDNYINMDDIKI